MKIALFLGAGASVPFEKPTTAQLKEKLQNKCNTTSSSAQFLSHFLNYKEYPDMEYILQAIKEIKDFFTNSGGKIFNYAGFGLHFHTSSGASMPFADFEKDVEGIERILEQEIFENYSWKYEEDHKSLYDVFLPIFNLLRSYSEKVTIFTTNYDRSIEEFCSLGNEFRCVDGFKQDPDSQRFLWNKGNYSYFDGDTNRVNVYLYKLHGSLNWKKHKQYGIERTTFERKPTDTNYTEDFLIYPTLSPKDGAEEEPYKTIRDRFVQFMKDADACVVIGFSFRDSHINNIFRPFIESGKVFIAISPSSMKNVCTNLLKTDIPADYDESKICSLAPSGGNNVWCIPQGIDKKNLQNLMDVTKGLIDNIVDKK